MRWNTDKDRTDFGTGEKMKKKMSVLYVGCVAVLYLFYIFICVTCKNDVFQARESSRGYRYLTEYESIYVKDSKQPLGIREEYVMRLQDLMTESGSLIFYTLHQNVEVYIDDKLVYSVRAEADNPFGKTPGSRWNAVPLYQQDEGRAIRVVLGPAYESIVGTIPDFYFGSKFDVFMMLMAKNLIPFILSLAAILIGLVFIIFTVYNYRNSEVDKSLMMMGFFAMGIGTWKMSDMDCMGLLFPYSLGLTYLPYLALMVLVIPFAMFAKELFSKKEHPIWYVVCFLSLFVNFISVLLQITRIKDLRETLKWNHLTMLLLVILVSSMLVYELRKKGWNDKLKTMVVCMAACLIGFTADIVVYYISGGASAMVLGMACFLIYIIVLGIRSVQEMKRLMRNGMEAKHYEQMAYHDQLTGLYNRTAYAAFTEKADFTPEQCIVVMFDLNDLKKCNDTCGHDKGDRYIVQSAKLIWRSFGDLGKCYRMGGDEFCALLKGASVSECEERLQKLKKAADACNQREPDEFPIQIACGYERYDNRIDYDLSDTLRRADKMMYREKIAMKQKKEKDRKA